MMQLTEQQQQKIAAFLFNGGHANVRFVGKYVVYRDQTRGMFAMDKTMAYEPILALVEDKSLDEIQRLVNRAILHQTNSEFEVDDLGKWRNDPHTLLELASKPYLFDTLTRYITGYKNVYPTSV